MSPHPSDSHDEPLEETFTVEEVLAKLQELHAQGILDLDAPARELVQVADANMSSATFRERKDEADAYWLVGSKGWYSHVSEEEVGL